VFNRLRPALLPNLVAGSGIGFSDWGETDLKDMPGTWRLLAALL
jgi:hypothetical protein